MNYIKGRPAQRRRRAILLRYPPSLWNQYEDVLEHRARTNNCTEGWHNGFQVVVGKHRPSFYKFLELFNLEKQISGTF